MKKIYISGGITFFEDWKEHFNKAQKMLIEKGYVVISPVLISEEVEKEIEKPTYADYMRADLRMLCICDAVYFLDNWEGSRGARVEKEVANILGLEQLFEIDFIKKS